MDKRRFLDQILPVIAKKIEEHAKDLNIIGHFEPYDFPDHVLQSVQDKPYYSCLASFVDLFDIESVLEIGTCTGASALVMSKYAKKILTCDITDQFFHDTSIFETNKIESFISPNPEACLELDFPSFDMIFVDVDHGGHWEKLIHEKIIDTGFSGLVFYDDISLSQGMCDFWEGIMQEKLKTNWHYTSFGIVKYL